MPPGAPPQLASPPPAGELWQASHVVAHHLVRCGYTFAASYPGSPTTLITGELERLQQRGLIAFRYATNEKIAFEMAAAVAIAGGRAAAVMKHVGVNVALDSAMALAYTGHRGALLLIVGDDPSCESSSNEQDSRLMARLLGVPCLEPSSIDDLAATVERATELSVETGALTLLRLTTALCYSSGPLDYRRVTSAAPQAVLTPPRSERRFQLTPAVARESRGHALARLDAAQTIGERPALWSEASGDGETGVAFLVQNALFEPFERACRRHDVRPPSLRATLAWPIAEAPLRSFLARHSRVVVLEEMEPLLEEQAAVIAHRAGLATRIEGRALRPRFGRLDGERLIEVLGALLGRATPTSSARPGLELAVPPRPPTFCAGCPHTASIYSLKRLIEASSERPFVASDIGCYTLGTKPGLEVGDVVLCMGASIGVATGAALAGQRSIALIGDSTFLHAGLPALRNAVDQQVNLLVCILDNGVAAMTGGQPAGSPGLESLAATALALGARAVEVADPFDAVDLGERLTRLLGSPGVSVLIARSPCALHQRPLPRRPRLDEARCNGCGDCVTKIHCPAISLSSARKFVVALESCVGCGFCSVICPERAITPVAYP